MTLKVTGFISLQDKIIMITFFWIALFIIFYTYAGYGLLLFFLVRVKRWRQRRNAINTSGYSCPSLTLVVAAHNEERSIDEKIRNTLSLIYPQDRIRYIFITDGSTDTTVERISAYPEIKLMHQPDRKGKIHAIHRAMKEVDSEVVVFTDANTFLNKTALLKIVAHYADPGAGAVSGEKRVRITESADATAGEGFYWKYESKLKKWDSELHTVVGAAGELFSIRTALYEPVEDDTLLDDFMISMRIAQKGYRIVYEPGAYAIEDTSANTKEELKRKIRIAAGGVQSIMRLKSLLNPFAYPVLSFQYLSHRVLRWTITPLLMIAAFILNIAIVYYSGHPVYKLLLILQLLFYSAALFGWMLERKEIKLKVFFIPFYFCLMNYAVMAGMVRYFSMKQQNATWERARRK
jgi:poly-beta-1,6-N-acetyl-D-glucosamine synthase